MADFLLDNFTDAAGTLATAHTSDSGATIAKHALWSGDAVITATGTLRKSSGVAIQYYSAVPPSADHQVTARCRFASTPANNPGIVARMSTTANSWLWCSFNGSVVQLQTTNVAALGNAPFVPVVGTWFVVKIVCVGTTAQVYIDNVLYLDFNNNTGVTAAGRVGYALLDSPADDNSGFQIDWIKAGPVQGFAAAPLNVPTNQSSNVVLTLSGTNTAWDGTTVFTVSGVTGVTKVSQSVTSATTATLTITTGATAGTLTITESVTGTSTTTVTVAAPTLSIGSPAYGVTDVPATVTFNGANTIWLQRAPTFAAAGIPGASVGAVTVVSNTQATATVTFGTTAGILTLAETTAGGSATLTVVAELYQVGIDGDSLALPAEWAAYLKLILGQAWGLYDYAVGGNTAAQRLAAAPAGIFTVRKANRLLNLLILQAGTNDKFLNNTDATTIFTTLKNYWIAARAAGFLPVATTIIDRRQVGTPADFQAVAASVNSLIRTECFNYCVGLLDLAADPRFQDGTNATYFRDLTHLTAAGDSIVAEKVAALLYQLAAGGRPGYGLTQQQTDQLAAVATAVANGVTLAPAYDAAKAAASASQAQAAAAAALDAKGLTALAVAQLASDAGSAATNAQTAAAKGTALVTTVGAAGAGLTAVKVAADGLDAITAAAPAGRTQADTWPKLLMYAIRTLINDVTRNPATGRQQLYGDDGSTPIGTANALSDGVTERRTKYTNP